ncbi:uncharacterized protein LOC113565412 [Drosophila persimilis]|uniref:uncharacterized protein LOC113565412 n=1 Tax=Drosophila persimilis TaxID=7234 RepID=UPI000F07B512|nr:uncharacterized protein LOC113565412 [Drosophila persimilis]
MRKSLILFEILTILCLTQGRTGKNWRQAMYDGCLEPLPNKNLDIWRLPKHWHRQYTYPPIYMNTVCPAEDSYVYLSLENLANPPLNYFPLLPVPFLLCTDYNHYAVLVFCYVEKKEQDFQVFYNQSMVLTVEKHPMESIIKKTQICLKNFPEFKFFQNMTKVRFLNC